MLLSKNHVNKGGVPMPSETPPAYAAGFASGSNRKSFCTNFTLMIGMFVAPLAGVYYGRGASPPAFNMTPVLKLSRLPASILALVYSSLYRDHFQQLGPHSI